MNTRTIQTLLWWTLKHYFRVIYKVRSWACAFLITSILFRAKIVLYGIHKLQITVILSIEIAIGYNCIDFMRN